MSDIIIEKIQKKDAIKVKKFFDDALENTFRLTFPPEAIEMYKDDWDIQNLNNAINDNARTNIYAKKDNTVVGILFGSSVKAGIGTIIWLIVSSEYRGKGIGKMLCNTAEKEFKNKGAHKVVLYTETEKAKDFYLKIGYSLEGIHPKHWWHVDHFCMSKLI